MAFSLIPAFANPMTVNSSFLAVAFALFPGWPALSAAPAVPGATVRIHASVPDPTDIDIAADGTVFCGRDNSGSGGRYEDAVKIHRVAPGGSPVSEFGDTAPADPDSVAIDRSGAITGTPGSVLAGGARYVFGSQDGRITAFTPAGVSSILIFLQTEISNPGSFVTDPQGRLVFNAYNPSGNTVKILRREAGGSLTTLVATGRPYATAFDALGRTVTSEDNGNPIRVFAADGTLLASHPIGRDATHLARAKGGFWGNSIYLFDPSHNLVCLEVDGSWRVVGTGFEKAGDLVFGDDDCLYVAEFDNDRILRIEPSPQLAISRDTVVHLQLSGMRGTAYRIETSDDLTENSWRIILEVTPETWPQTYVDAPPPGTARRFYRAVRLP
jgi:hypothetical protein